MMKIIKIVVLMVVVAIAIRYINRALDSTVDSYGDGDKYQQNTSRP